MITFYEWNKTFKTIIDNYNPQRGESQVDLKYGDLVVNGSKVSHIKVCKQKKMNQRHKVSDKLIIKEEEGKGEEDKGNIFRNSAIKHKFKSLSVQRTGSMLKGSFKKARLSAKDCEISVHKYLSQKLREGMAKSARKQIPKTNISIECEPMQTARPITRRYRTVCEADKGQMNNFLNSVSGDVLFSTHKRYTSMAGPSQRTDIHKKQSNLITNNSSLLSQILKRQKNEHDSSLRIVSFGRTEVNNTAKIQEIIDEEPTLTPKEIANRPFFSQRRQRKSMTSYKSYTNQSPKMGKISKRSILCTI